MNEGISCLTNKGKKEKRLLMNGKMMTLTFFKLYTVYIKEEGQLLSHIYFSTCLNKDTPVLLIVIKYLNIFIS